MTVPLAEDRGEKEPKKLFQGAIGFDEGWELWEALECCLLQEQLIGFIEIAVYMVGAPRVPQQIEEEDGKGKHTALANKHLRSDARKAKEEFLSSLYRFGN